MSQSCYKSFVYTFEPLKHISLTNDIYTHLNAVLGSEQAFWCHLESPSKNLQQQIAKRFALPKVVRMILFSEEARSRCVKHDKGCVLIIQGVQPSTMVDDKDFPTLRFWITKQGILSISTGKIQAVYDLQKNIDATSETNPIQCLTMLLEDLISYLGDSVYQIDEALNKIEANFEYTEESPLRVMSIRQDIIYLRRYVFPQRDALINLAHKLTFVTDSVRSELKELSDGMLRQVEAIEMLRERAVVIQDNLTNQIGEIANRRMYLLTIIMLLFTPAFFIMGMFSMYVPIPGMNSKLTWWLVSLLIIISSCGLYYLFKKKRWL